MKVLNRDGWMLSCPYCEGEIPYTLLNNQNGPVPFFYSENSNDILLRTSDTQKCEQLFEISRGVTPDLRSLEKLWLSILNDAPPSPSGGKFSLWANVKCPKCGKEIPYNNGVKDLAVRINEPRIVVVDGAVLLGDTEADTWKVKVRLSPAS